MSKVMVVRQGGWLTRVLDILMVPIMHLISIFAGAWGESPQHTHFWNIQSLTVEEGKRLSQFGRVDCKGVKGAIVLRHWWNHILFHLPFLKKGWKQYVVLAPSVSMDGFGLKWYVGWITMGRKVQISKIPLTWSVRMLLGPNDVSFFGIDELGHQISIREIGRGSVGDGGMHRIVPLG